MKKIILVLTVVLILFCSTAAYADTSEEGDSIVCMSNDIVKIEVLEIGFCDEAQMGYTESQQTWIINGETTEKTNYNDTIFPAPAGKKHFVIKAQITNLSDEPLIVSQDLSGRVIFPDGDETMIFAYPYQSMWDEKHNSIQAGASTPASFICTLSEEKAWYFTECSVEIAGITQHFDKENIVMTQKIAFSSIGKTDAPEQDTPYFDIEDCKIDEIKDQYFSIKTKVRNISGKDIEMFSVYFQILDEHEDILTTSGFAHFDIEAGQAVWSYAIQVRDVALEKVYAIRYTTATAGTPTTPHDYVSISEKPEFYLNKDSMTFEKKEK